MSVGPVKERLEALKGLYTPLKWNVRAYDTLIDLSYNSFKFLKSVFGGVPKGIDNFGPRIRTPRQTLCIQPAGNAWKPPNLVKNH